MTEKAKWVLAFLAVFGIVLTAPIWAIPYLLWRIFEQPIRDMKKVIDGEMKFW